MNLILQENLIPIAALLLQLAGITFVVLRDSYITRRQRRILLIIILLAFSLVAQNILEKYFRNNILLLPRTMNSIFGYSVRPIILYLFIEVVDPPKRKWPFWTMIALNAMLYMTSLFTDICFTITQNNTFFRGPLGYFCFYLSGALLLWNLIRIILLFQGKLQGWGIGIPVFCICIIVAGTAVDLVKSGNFVISLLTVTIVSSIVFYYIWLHLQYVRAHEDALMAQQRIQIMISQIQPHFLYNTLSTVQALCRTDPEKAFDTLEKFGTYLRQNLDSLDQAGLISFAKELEHTRVYAEIEMIRFPNVRVDYKIEETEFELPALTIQPLVENAIRHGVRIRETGIVSIETRRAGSQIQITIRDNGKGFDPAVQGNAPGRHIGIANVRERVERMCKGTLEIDSIPGKGTQVVVKLPLEKWGGKRIEDGR